MRFEFDEAKSQSNKAKHGIDFVEAQALWLDEMFIEVPARTQDEPRFVVIGMIAGQHWVGGDYLPGREDPDHLCPPVARRGSDAL